MIIRSQCDFKEYFYSLPCILFNNNEINFYILTLKQNIKIQN